jgi:hypothetical protein
MEGVQITITVEGVHPPVGIVTSSGGGQAERFTGWLGLLAVLSSVLDRAPAGQGGELEEGG